MSSAPPVPVPHILSFTSTVPNAQFSGSTASRSSVERKMPLAPAAAASGCKLWQSSGNSSSSRTHALAAAGCKPWHKLQGPLASAKPHEARHSHRTLPSHSRQPALPAAAAAAAAGCKLW
eukprot:1160412-Pelagomonas_calceolata.AAC.5